MLRHYNQFLLSQGVRSYIYLSKPPVIPSDEVELPRNTVVHYLDLHSEVHFPDRGLYYFNGSVPKKKVPISVITDLTRKEDTSTLENKFVNTQVRKWFQSNLSRFKNTDLKVSPNKDANVTAMYNYNLIKDMYNYKTSLLSNYNKYMNVATTYWSNVKASLEADSESINLVTINLPRLIPNFTTLNRLMSFNEIKLSKIISSVDLYWVLDIYKWLTNDNRPGSLLKEITDNESSRILLEIKVGGYSSFIPLNVLREISEESKLTSSTKIPPTKLQKVFLTLLRRIEATVTSLTSEEDPLEVPETPVEGVLDEDDVDAEVIVDNKIKELSVPITVDKEDLLDIEIDENSLFDDLLNEPELEDSYSDSFFNERIQQIEKSVIIPDTNTEEEDAPVIIPITKDEAMSKVKEDKASVKNLKKIESIASTKTHTSSEIRAMRKLVENRTLLKNPYNPKEGIDAFVGAASKDIPLTKEQTKLEVTSTLVNPNLSTDIIRTMDREYIDKMYRADIVSCVLNLEKADIVVKNYEVEEVRSSVDKYELHKVTIKHLTGKESTIYFRLPTIDSEGEFMVGGNKYRMRRQKTELPIRKISPIRVALTTNYGKLFVSRTERKTNDPLAYIVKYIQSDYLGENIKVKKLVPGTKRLNEFKCPNMYHLLGSKFTEIQLSEVSLVFDPNNHSKYLTKEVDDLISKKGVFFCGYKKNGNVLVMDMSNTIYDFSEGMVSIGEVEDLLGLDRTKIPKAFTTLKVLGTDIPLGVCLGYYLGISTLLGLTETTYKVLEPRERYTPENDELVLKLEDHKLVLKLDTVDKQLIFNGFTFYKDTLKGIRLSDLDSKAVYLSILEQRGGSLIYLKELDVLRTLFLDPISVSILEDINEPTEFLPLLLRASELLTTMDHPDINDPTYSRIRGYDRVPGLMYRALSESVREYMTRGKVNSKVNIDPYKVWNYITQDNTVKSVEDLNPILNTKELEATTFTGQDGLNKDATPKELRRYHKNDIGLVSEATVDSSDVALNFSISPYAKLKSVRGLVDIDNKDYEEDPSKVFSASAQMSPFIEHDDAVRLNSANVQFSHTIPSAGYRQGTVRTEYEYIMPYKVGKLYAVMAKDGGVVQELSDYGVTVKYKSGEVSTYPIGTQYGRMEGSIYPQELRTDLKVGDKFKAGDPITYNTGYFERDWFDPSKILMKTTSSVTVALTMTSEVFEDSSAISSRLSKTMSTSIIKEKKFIIDFNSAIHNLHPVGSPVKPEDVLFMVLDDTSDHTNLSESSILLLQNLASLSPRAKVDGILDRYEIKYNGDLNDMSPSLKKLTTTLNKEIYNRTKGTEYEAKDNRVSSEYYTDGENLNLDTLELKVFIRVPLDAQIGDKGVFGNQMRSVISEVYTYELTTESGDIVDAQFSYKGVLNRKVSSPIMVGAIARTCRLMGPKVAELYFRK